MKDSLRVEVVSRTKPLWRGRADHVSIPAGDGRLGILRGRQPLLTTLGEGMVEIDRSGDSQVRVHVEGGFASVDSDFITVVAEGGEILED